MDRATTLADVNLEVTKTLLGNRALSNGKIAIGTTKSKVKTVANIDYCIDGQIYSLAATDDFFVHTDLTVQPLLSTKWYALCVNAAGTGSIIQGPNNLTANVTAVTNKAALPKIPADLCCVGAIKIVTAVAATYTPATTLNDAANVTTTYYNLSAVPSAGVPA